MMESSISLWVFKAWTWDSLVYWELGCQCLYFLDPPNVRLRLNSTLMGCFYCMSLVYEVLYATLCPAILWVRKDKLLPRWVQFSHLSYEVPEIQTRGKPVQCTIQYAKSRTIVPVKDQAFSDQKFIYYTTVPLAGPLCYCWCGSVQALFSCWLIFLY